ncbi:hypothetical protein K1719_037431 [Acacia pycnantha]|nr:hypothetical protein K1719_037431 [Acacia pycnantha]
MGVASGGRYPILSMTSEQYTSWCKPWMNSIIIKVLGLSVPKHVLIDRVRRMWKPKQPLKVVPLSNEYYIVSFSSKEDCDYAYYEGPWMIDDHYLLVQQWRPNFNPRKADCQRKVAVWVRIPNLPLEFCTVESLGIIGNMIGRMIKIDRSTSIYDKGEFARICVEEWCDLREVVVGECSLNATDGKLGEKSTKGNEGSLKDPPKNSIIGNEGVEIHTGNDDGRNSAKKKQAVDGVLPPVVDQVPRLVSETSSGCNHLGPQMVFCSDLRRTTGGMAGNKEKARMGVAAKSGGGMHGIQDISHGVMKREGNKVGSKGSAKSVQASVKSEGVILGNSNKTINDTLKKKPEWIIVGSKRKKEEGPRIFGKETTLGPNRKDPRQQEGTLKDDVIMEGVQVGLVGSILETKSQLHDNNNNDDNDNNNDDDDDDDNHNNNNDDDNDNDDDEDETTTTRLTYTKSHEL